MSKRKTIMESELELLAAIVQIIEKKTSVNI